MGNDVTTTNDRAIEAFSAQSLTPSMMTILDRAFEPTATFSVADIALIAPIASCEASIQVVSERTIRQSLAALSTSLPSKDHGEAGSRLQLNTYMAMLAGCDERALAHACRRCLDELDWFPTIRQIKERMQHWVSPEAVAISRARVILRTGRRTPEADDRADLPLEELDRVNAFLRTRGIATRFAADGTTYQEAPLKTEAA